MTGTWITWEARGPDRFTNPRATRAHWTEARESAVSVGGLPLACGRWSPDGWDAEITPAPHARRCRRCERALAAREEAKHD